MVSIYKMENRQTKDGKDYITGELRGLSTDTKPTKLSDAYIDNGTMFIEIDTGKLFLFDLDSNSWKEI